MVIRYSGEGDYQIRGAESSTVIPLSTSRRNSLVNFGKWTRPKVTKGKQTRLEDAMCVIPLRSTSQLVGQVNFSRVFNRVPRRCACLPHRPIHQHTPRGLGHPTHILPERVYLTSVITRSGSLAMP